MTDADLVLAASIAALEAAVADLVGKRNRLNDNIRIVVDQIDRLNSQRVADLDLTDPAQLRELFVLDWSDGRGNEAASARLTTFYGDLMPAGSWYSTSRYLTDDDAGYVTPELTLRYLQPVSDLALALDRVSAIVAEATQVETVRFAIMEHTLAESGIWEIEVTPTGRAALTKQTYGVRYEIDTGALVDVLMEAATEAWYSDGPEGIR